MNLRPYNNFGIILTYNLIIAFKTFLDEDLI